MSSPRPATLDWRESAACLNFALHNGDAVFFPERGQSYAPARRICKRCPVKSRCLDYAVTSKQDYGVWGGLTPEERAFCRRGTCTHQHREVS